MEFRESCESMSFPVSANKEQGTNLGGFEEERGVVDNRPDLNNHSFRLESPRKDKYFHSASSHFRTQCFVMSFVRSASFSNVVVPLSSPLPPHKSRGSSLPATSAELVLYFLPAPVGNWWDQIRLPCWWASSLSKCMIYPGARPPSSDLSTVSAGLERSTVSRLGRDEGRCTWGI